MKFLEDQFRRLDGTEGQGAGVSRQKDPGKTVHDSSHFPGHRDSFNKNPLLKQLFQDEVNEGM